MGEEKNIDNIVSEEEISNEEAIDIARKIASDNEVILEALINNANTNQQNRRYRILKVRDDIDHSMNGAIGNAIMCGVSSLAFMSFAQIAAQKLGMPSIIECFQNATIPNANPDLGYISNAIEFFQNYVQNVFGSLNAKEFLAELGPVGSMSGLLAIFSGKNVLKNLKEWNAKNRELNIMRETMPEDVAKTRKALSEFNFSLALQSIRNTGSKIAQTVSNFFKKKNIEFQVQEPKAIAGFDRKSIDNVSNMVAPHVSQSNNDTRIMGYNNTELNNDTHIGRSK